MELDRWWWYQECELYKMNCYIITVTYENSYKFCKYYFWEKPQVRTAKIENGSQQKIFYEWNELQFTGPSRFKFTFMIPPTRYFSFCTFTFPLSASVQVIKIGSKNFILEKVQQRFSIKILPVVEEGILSIIIWGQSTEKNSFHNIRKTSHAMFECF